MDRHLVPTVDGFVVPPPPRTDRSNDDLPSEKRSKANTRKPFSAGRLLVLLAHGTAPFITTFVIIHLSAPVLANVGGSSLASQAMLLGREYYQTPFAEKLLVTGPIVVHAFSSIIRRLVPRLRRGGGGSSPDPAKPIPMRSLLSPLAFTGYAALALVLPIHYPIHRLFPADPGPPILAVGPSELDFEFVKAGLHTWPIRSWLLYAALVGCVVAHGADGMFLLLRTYGAGVRGRNKWRTLALVGALPVMTGLYVLWNEPAMAYAGTIERFRAAFSTSILYRL